MSDAPKNRFVVFYSWQAVRPGAIGRSFIQEALERAVKNIRSDTTIAVEPVVDRDTAGVPGAPNIAGTIFEKIERADAIIADVTIVSPLGAERSSPNPNVLLELGYAIRDKGWLRTLIVMNTHYGPPENLPFDLRGHRAMTYSLAEAETDRSRTR